MVLDDICQGDLRIDSQSTRHPDSRDNNESLSQAVSGSVQPAHESAVSPADGLTDRFEADFGPSVTVSTESVTATLLGTPRIDLQEYVFPHQLERHRATGETRVCALFDIENTSRRPIQWGPRQTTFVGTDAYTYRQAQLSLDPSRLGPGCHSRLVEIQPGCRARVMTLVEQLPSTVEVARVIHTVGSHHANRRRLTFDVQ